MSYSKLNLLGQEIQSHHSKSFIGKLAHKISKSTSVTLSIDVPIDIYMRSEIFCEDIQDLAEISFTKVHLMNLLYEDFLMYARKTNNPKIMLGLLTSLDVKDKKKPTIFLSSEDEPNFKTIYFQMRYKQALRGEVILADLEEMYPNHGYTVEKVSELLYNDFIKKHKSGKNVVDQILKLLDD